MTTTREKRNPDQNRVELLQGTLDMLILQTLQWGPQHGYGISHALRIRSGEVLQVETGRYIPRYTGWSGSTGCARSGS